MNASEIPPSLALSIKQPWVSLVLLGLKSIEIRRWATPIRGRVYLHAGKIADDRPEGWALVPKEMRELTERRGGVVGMVDLTECFAYETAASFARDRQLHRNLPSWFLPPRLYGYRFEKPEIVPFHACLGQVKFFPVTVPPVDKPPKPPRRRKVVAFEIAAAKRSPKHG